MGWAISASLQRLQNTAAVVCHGCFCIFGGMVAGKITALVAQKHNRERVSVFVDGEFAFGLALIEAIKLGKGQELTDAEIERLRGLDEIEVAHESALKLLSYRPRSIAEVRKRLQEKDISPQAVEVVLERLQAAKLLDDQAFARYWVDNRDQFGPRSIRALRVELRRKGISDGDIRASLEGLDEEEAAYRAAKAQARRLDGEDKQGFRKRLGEFLLRRGFGYDVIKTVVSRLWKERSTGGDLLSPDTDIDFGE